MRNRLPLFALFALAPALGAAGACGGAQSEPVEANEALEGVVAAEAEQPPTAELVTIEQGEPIPENALGELVTTEQGEPQHEQGEPDHEQIFPDGTITDDMLGEMIGFSLPEGPACASSTDCDEGMFCAFDVGHCGELDTPGVCMTPPEMCTMDWSPVCGCDGQTYGNVCGAWAAGASPVHFGECETTDDLPEGPIETEPGIGDGATPPPPVEPTSTEQPTSMPTE